MQTRYAFRPGVRIGGVSADVVGSELARIKKRDALTAEAVLDAATPEDAPLHPAFPWDDAEAARQHRLNLARRIIRGIVIVRPDQTPRSVYVHVQQPNQRPGKYEELAVIVDHPDEFATALGEAERKLQSAQEAVSELLEVAQRTEPVDWSGVVVVASQALTTAREALAHLKAS